MLCPVQGRILAAQRHQFFMAALFGDATVFEVQDKIALFDGDKVMRDPQGCTAASDAIQRARHLLSVLTVEASGGFIEKQQRCPADGRARYRDALPLPA